MKKSSTTSVKASRTTNREKLLETGLRVMHQRGFVGASVRDIVQAAGVPQGSFTNHFPSKEAFSLEILEAYLAKTRQVIAQTLQNESLPPLRRLRTYLDANIACVQDAGVQHGCLFGNFGIEATEHSEAVRLRLIEVYDELQTAVAHCLRAAVQARELPPALDCEGTAAFIFSWFEGALLVAKTQHSLTQLQRTKDILFATVLAPHRTMP